MGLRQVVKDAPEFKRGWANLLLAESADPSALQDLTSARRRQLQQDIKRARQLDPKVEPLHLTPAEIDALVAMMEALDGEGYQDTAPAAFPQ